MSDEALYGSSTRPSAAALAHRPERRELRLVVYLRRQDDHLVSRYQQVVKTGEVRRLAERTRELDLSKTYDYHARLRTWQRLVEPTSSSYAASSATASSTGRCTRTSSTPPASTSAADDCEQVDLRNESLDAETVEFLRILNIHRVEPEGAELGRDRQPASWSPAWRDPHRTDLDVARERARRVHGAVGGVEPAVAREFLGDESGELFRHPRKTRTPPPSSVLDPAGSTTSSHCWNSRSDCSTAAPAGRAEAMDRVRPEHPAEPAPRRGPARRHRQGGHVVDPELPPRQPGPAGRARPALSPDPRARAARPAGPLRQVRRGARGTPALAPPEAIRPGEVPEGVPAPAAHGDRELRAVARPVLRRGPLRVLRLRVAAAAAVHGTPRQDACGWSSTSAGRTTTW